MSGNNPIGSGVFLATVFVPQLQNDVVKLSDLDDRGLLVEVTLEQPATAKQQSIEVLYDNHRTEPQDLVAGQKATYYISKEHLARHVGETKILVVWPGPTRPSDPKFTIQY